MVMWSKHDCSVCNGTIKLVSGGSIGALHIRYRVEEHEGHKIPGHEWDDGGRLICNRCLTNILKYMETLKP